MALDPAVWLDGLPYIPASHMKPRSNAPTLIVVHSMESPERTGAARGSASYHALPSVIGSAQVHVDDVESIRGVPDDHVANGAAGGVNSRALHVEMAGRAAQSAAEWDDTFSRAVIDRAAHTVAAWCVRYGIAPVALSTDDLRAGRAGLCRHVDVTNALGGTHWDPGPNFPWAAFVARVQELTGDDVDYQKLSDLIDARIAKSWAEGGASYKGCGTVVKRQLRTQLVDKVLRKPAKTLREKVAGVFKSS